MMFAIQILKISFRAKVLLSAKKKDFGVPFFAKMGSAKNCKNKISFATASFFARMAK